MPPLRRSALARISVLVLVTGLIAACLAPLIGEPLEERAALWVVTDRALVRVGLDGDGTHRTTEPVPGAAAAEVRVRGNRMVTARSDALTSHELTPTLQLGEGTTVAMDPAPVSGLAVSAAADHVWLARPVGSAPSSTSKNAKAENGKGNKHGHGPKHRSKTTRITALSGELVPQWQRELPGRVLALASGAVGSETDVWALQRRQLTGLDALGHTTVVIPLPRGPKPTAFTPLGGDRFALASLRGVRVINAAGVQLAARRLVATRALHATGEEGAAEMLWAVGRHRLALLDAGLGLLQRWHLPPLGIGRTISASIPDPRDHSLWFMAGNALYKAHPDGTLERHRRLLPYLGTDPVTDLAIYADTFAPELTVIEPQGRLVTNNDQPDLLLGYSDVGIGVDTDTLSIERGGEPLEATCEPDTEAERIECEIGPLDDGSHTIVATIADYAGNESEPVEAVFEIDTVPPEITVESPLDGDFVNREQVIVQGRLSETAELTIDGEAVGLDVDDRFEHVVPLTSDGLRVIELTAEDGAGNSTTRTITVNRDTVAPSVVVAAAVTVEPGDTEGKVRIMGADGSAEPEAEVVITNTNPATVASVVVEATAAGGFVAQIEGEVGDTYTIVVRDRADNESDPQEVTGESDESEVPPDPAEIAPPLPEVGIAPFDEQVSFLYEGPDAIQQGVAPGTIEEERVSILRGEVHDRAGAPLPGVRVSILNHPELGSTRTQADGGFDMAVNGGSRLTVEYRKNGFLPVQRSVDTEWNGWFFANDVVMIPLDDRVTTIDLADTSQPFQVARGNVVSDADGTRQATLLFPAGTTAEITLPDGSKKQLSQLDIRATEYTVGESGPRAMPGELPPTSAYTYAVELSADQALAQGVKVAGKEVVFNQPIPFYVDNFLDFPVGEPVPIGYYNDDTAAWMPHPNGRIVGILREEAGFAVLDVIGDGNPATVDQLNALNITDDERARLAELYSPGDSLWRMTTTHLSTWDHNWPYGPPEDAEAPDVELPETDQSDEPDESDEQNNCKGCSISPQRQSLGEQIDIAGTPYSLHYESSRASGARDSELVVPLTGANVPDSLESVRLRIMIAGRLHVHEFSAASNQQYVFDWDGMDGFGRKLSGSAVANIEVSYVYACQYYGSVGRATLGGGASVFGRFGDIARPIGVRDRCQGFSFPVHSTALLEPPASSTRAAGNWSLSVEHSFFAGNAVLERGDGTDRSLGTALIETVAGDLSFAFPPFDGDGGPATEAHMSFPEGVALAPDGSLYIADTSNNRIRRVSPDGIIDTVAGSGFFGFGGDGGPAVDAALRTPRGVAVAPDGSLYIADTSNHRVRLISPDGIIETVAGTGTGGFSGDGGPAEDAQLQFPYKVTIGRDGSLYIADHFNSRIRRVSPAGVIETIAGIGSRGFSGDGGAATEAELNFPSDVALRSDGSVYIVDQHNHRVRRVTPDGTIETITGTGVAGSNGDGGPAENAQLDRPHAIAVAGDGSVYVAEDSGNRVRRVSPDGVIETVVGDGSRRVGEDGIPAIESAVSGPKGLAFANGILYLADTSTARVRRVIPASFGSQSDGERMVASRDADRVFSFDSLGRHTRTLSAGTGEVVLEFGRDAEGNLTSIVDGDGNAISIDRDASGKAVAIIAAHGQRTDMVVDDDGHLVSLADPTGSVWSMNYTSDGLLTRIERPDGSVNTFSYDEGGRLLRDTDPNEGGWQLSRAELDDGYRVQMLSKEGRSYRFTTERPDSFTRRYTREAPDGTTTERIHTDTDTTIERADGTRVITEELPDPRFGFAARYVADRRIEMPSGLVLQQNTNREAALSNPVDPLSLQGLSRTRTTNGRTSTADYDAAAREWVLTSSEGRTLEISVDGQGRPTEQSTPGIEAVRFSYDTRGRLATIEQGTTADPRFTAFAYHDTGSRAGYLASITDAERHTTSFETDALGRVTEQTLPDGRTIGYQYDGRGNLVALTPPGREAHVFEYDGLDQRTEYTPPSLDGIETVTRRAYNLDRQIREIERPGGELITFEYDSGGRLSARHMPAGDTTYGYDSTTGQIASIAAPGGGTLQFQWDGFLPVSTDWTGTVSGNVSRTFDNNFWVTQESVNGSPINFGYDDDGLLTTAGDVTISRDANNGLITGTTQAAVTGTRAYNAFGELADRSVTADGTIVYGVEFTRDKLGRIVTETETIGGDTKPWGYEYDQAGRLVEVILDGTPVHLYGYDANGNRISHTGPSGTVEGSYDAQDRITAYGDATYTHTLAGERASKTTPAGTTTYDYDGAGNLREVVLPDGPTIEYLVDGRDRRIGKIVDGVFERGWLYRDQFNPVAEVDGTGTVVSRFVYADKPNVPAYMIRDGKTYRLISDHLGSVRLVVDTETNVVVQRLDYSPFGSVITDTNPEFQPFGYAGGLYDAATGLTRFGARDYDPETGRWTAKDPILFRGGDTNLFGYVLNDPVNAIDPNGLAAQCPADEPAEDDEDQENDEIDENDRLPERIKDLFRDLTGEPPDDNPSDETPFSPTGPRGQFPSSPFSPV